MDGKVCCLPRELQYQYERGKISCRRLEWEGGAVSSRVALLLRSAEAQPYLPRFVWFFQTFFSFFWCWWLLDRQLAQTWDFKGTARVAKARERVHLDGISEKVQKSKGGARPGSTFSTFWQGSVFGDAASLDFFDFSTFSKGVSLRRRDFLTFSPWLDFWTF